MAVYKDKKRGTWFVSYKNTTKRGFKTKFEAQQYEAKMRLKSDDVTVGVRFHDVCEDFKAFKKKRVTHGTYNKIRVMVDKHIVPNTKNQQMSLINQMDVRRFDEYVRSTDYATRTKRTIMNYYKAIFKHSEIYFENTNNPTNILETIPFTDEEKIQQVRNEQNIWTVPEFSAFIEEVDDPEYKTLYNILYFTGMRLGEALALTWEDYEDGSLSISKSLTRKTNKGTYKILAPKTKTSIRTVQLGDYLNDLIKEYKKTEQNKEGFKDSWFILGGTSPLPQTTIDYKKDNACKEAGVRRIRIHDFRHSHASNLISDGVGIPAVSKRLGHSDINITLKVYTHLIKEDEERLLDSINQSTNML